ncbi:hypothetical protein NBT05_05070 [Aquimarina sp. ERC-38]|uniref:hypothetical protein n=1 Tax=Aquimarina sp. ERC-38 TaxID=2949996 RepID=UPI002247B2AD|nr:hypothetical protein [Aquimarina sp. ERC-38]UZO81837.1 hypothetical protein NBT05_05070 [Aquimarina sp. ERC-38]
MTKQFKVVKVINHWSLEKFRAEIETTLNSLSKQGWKLESIDYISGSYLAMIIVSK